MSERPQLMSEREVVELMESSTSPAEWNANCETVKLLHGGVFPEYWKRVLFGTGLAQRKEREWQLAAFREAAAKAGPLYTPEIRDALIPPPADTQLLAQATLPPGANVHTALAALQATRRAVQAMGVPPSEWAMALGAELAHIMGHQHATCRHDAQGFRTILESLIEAVRGTAWDVRARIRKAEGLPDDRPPDLL